jgi:3-polyprenyl-4-hydroxybenzoate decarboxylase
MNHEEIEHLRDKFLAAAISGVLSNPALVQKDTKPQTAVSLINSVVNRVLDQREKYYKYEDAQRPPKSAVVAALDTLVSKDK